MSAVRGRPPHVPTKETQDLVDFCALHRIQPEITKIAMNGIDDAWKKVVEKQARYRYVIDMGAR